MAVNLHPHRLQGGAIVHAIKQAKVNTVVALPDIVTCESTLWPISGDPDLTLVPVCKEDEGVSICAGLSYCEQRAVLLIQHTGFLDSINAIRAIAIEYALPVVMIVGLQGMEADRLPADSEKYGLKILQPICQAMALDYHWLVDESDTATITHTIEQAYQHSRPVVMFVVHSPECSQ